MSLAEIKALIESNKDNTEVNTYLQGLNPLTTDKVASFLDTEDGKKVLQPKLDGHFTKGLETWKTKSLPSIIDEEVKKRNPDETPEQKRIRELEDKINQSEKRSTRETLKVKVLNSLTEKGLPTKLLDLLIGEDEMTTESNIATLESVFNVAVTAEVEKKFKDGGRIVHKSKDGEYDGKNPWKKESFNLTLQGKILKEDPQLADRLKAAAKN